MEKKEIKRVLERIYRFLKDNKGRFYVDDCETVTLYEGMSEIIEQELDKAREEGYQNCMDDIWEKARELRAWTEHDGNICANDIEAGLQEAYLEISKLKQ